MAKLNQTQRDYFQRRVECIQSEKRTAFILEQKAALPELELEVPRLTRENVEAGKWRIKNMDELFSNENTNYTYWNNGVNIKQLFDQVISNEAAAAKVIYDRRLAAYDKAMATQRRQFTDQIMLGGDEVALAALATLESTTLEIPE